jgi:O-methyltransferase involved in polyketide biosynthesis
MDTTFFRILPELENYICRFYELDFKSVITAKKSIILHSEILRVMAEDKLRLLHCDLRLVASLEEALRSSDFDFKKPTLFYSECVVNYLRPHE